MTQRLIAYVAALVIYGVVDFVWLRLTVGPLYQAALGEILAPKPNMGAAAAFYLFHLVGIMIFCVDPALQDGDWKTAAVRGLLFGFFVYAGYDLTNLATLKVWSLKVSLIDIVWGGIVTGITAGGATAVTQALAK